MNSAEDNHQISETLFQKLPDYFSTLILADGTSVDGFYKGQQLRLKSFRFIDSNRNLETFILGLWDLKTDKSLGISYFLRDPKKPKNILMGSRPNLDDLQKELKHSLDNQNLPNNFPDNFLSLPNPRDTKNDSPFFVVENPNRQNLENLLISSTIAIAQNFEGEKITINNAFLSGRNLPDTDWFNTFASSREIYHQNIEIGLGKEIKPLTFNTLSQFTPVNLN